MPKFFRDDPGRTPQTPLTRGTDTTLKGGRKDRSGCLFYYGSESVFCQ